MKILALDTALNGCGVGVLDSNSGTCLSRGQPMLRGHAEAFVPLIQSTLEDANADFYDIGLLAVTVGPGAFTGLRIGLSTARALGLSLKIPVVGITTLDVIAAAFFAKGAVDSDLLVLLETKRTDFYGQLFSKAGDPLSDPFAAPADMIAENFIKSEVILIGDANPRFSGILDEEKKAFAKEESGFELPDPGFLARLGYAAFSRGDFKPPVPVYLRGADVTLSTRPRRIIADL